MGDEVYLKLAGFLDELPGGYPATPEGIEIDILKRLFTPDEAELAMQTRLFPEPASVIAARLDRTEDDIEAMLDSMARKGLVIGLPGGGRTYYMASQFVIGIHEFQVDRLQREHIDSIEPYLPYFVDEMTPIKQFRVVPVNSSIDATSTVTPHERIRELVSGHTTAAVADCICRKGEALAGNACGKPQESCLVFSYAADYYTKYGKARKVTIDEALSIIDMADRAGLVLMATHSKDIVNVCCCCSCCCAALELVKMSPRPVEHLYSEFQATVSSPEDCTLCETCLERCQMDAVSERDGAMWVDPDRCIGCGLCVSTCESDALALHHVYRPEELPANQFHMLAEISKERGKGFGKLSPMMKHSDAGAMLKGLNILYRSGIGRPMTDFMSRRGWI